MLVLSTPFLTIETMGLLGGLLKGTGFSFANYNAHEMLDRINFAKHIYYDKKREWNKMIDRAMAVDFSWKQSALEYQALYDWLIG